MEKFPHTVQLHRDLAKDGLVMLSLDVNPLELEEKETARVVKFLGQQKADFPHYIVRDDEDVAYEWLKKYDATATPAMIVFNRKGERVVVPEVTVAGTPAQKKAAQLKAERELVQKLLAEK